MYTFLNYKKRTDKQSRNVWTSFYGTSQYLCMLFETISLKMDIKKEGVFQPSIKSIILFYITPSNRDGIELQRNCSNKKPQNAITVMYLFIIDIPPRILANVNCPHSAIGISRVSPFQGRT